MLRQKRFSHRNSINHSLNLYANENISLLSPIADHSQNTFIIAQPKIQKNLRRSALGQIQKNCNLIKEAPQEGCFSKFGNYAVRGRYDQSPQFKDQDLLFNRISELIKHEENRVPICHSGRSKKFIRRNDRPYTSLSNKNRSSLNASSFGKGQVVLDLTPRQDSQELQDPAKASTSRALMNYSKVYRNSSGDRFKVRRDKHYAQHFALVSAQRMVLQEKLRPEKKEAPQRSEIPENPSSSTSRHRRRTSKAEQVKPRYAEQEQQFQIEGWEYFQ